MVPSACLLRACPRPEIWGTSDVYWLAQTHLQKGEAEKAGDEFARLVQQFPNSSKRLEAAISETTIRSGLGQWERVIELLEKPDGVFQIASRASPTNELALQGHLLLSEAQFSRGNYEAAEKALQPVVDLPLLPRLAWHRQFLACRIQMAQGKTQEAFAGTTNLLGLAASTSEKPLIADSTALQAALLERLNRGDEAMGAYERNLAEGVPTERQRQALLKIAELSFARERFDKAAQMFERFCAQFRESPARELGLLALGELRLRQHLLGPVPASAQKPGTNAPPSTNHLQLALDTLNTLLKDYPQGSLLGKAKLNIGWCFWLQDKMPEARTAFGEAAQALPASMDQAVALYKTGEAQHRLGDFAGAVTNYSAMVERYKGTPDVRSNLFEPVLYQAVRAAVAAGDFATATNAMGNLLEWYPSGYQTERAVLVAGQQLSRKGNPAKAREIYQGFLKLAPEAPLAAEVGLAVARTYEEESNWPLVVQQYDEWLGRFTNSPATQPRAEYFRAWANFQAGRETNAFHQFTNFVAKFPKDAYAPLAQWWVADYYFRAGKMREADANFQSVFFNWPKSELAYHARLMAGRTAAERRVWGDAITYFTSLTSDEAKCPPNIWAQAMFAYGNVLMSMDSTNKLGDYADAITVFNRVYQRFPTNQVAVLALGEKAGCLLQWAQTAPQFEAVAAEFHKLITNQVANLTARSIARFGLGVVYEKQARQTNGTVQTALLTKALERYLEVFYYDNDLKENERPDPYWVKRSGFEAARLTETLQNWTQAERVYERLLREMPSLRPTIEKKLVKVRENLNQQRVASKV